MRFAGTRIEGFLGDSPDYGKIATGGSTIKSKEGQAATDLMGKTAAAGISAAGEVKGAEIKGAAQRAMASAQSQAAMMGMIGQIGGAAIGAIPKSSGYNLGDSYDFKFDSSNVWDTPIDTGGFNYHNW